MIKLRQLGVQKVDVVEDGVLALEYLQDNSPDLIFLDIKMPTMNGFEFLKLNEQFRFAPQASIVMLSSSVMRCDRELSLQFSGVIDYLEKPLDREKIERVLSKIITDKRMGQLSY